MKLKIGARVKVNEPLLDVDERRSIYLAAVVAQRIVGRAARVRGIQPWANDPWAKDRLRDRVYLDMPGFDGFVLGRHLEPASGFGQWFKEHS